MTQRSLIYVGLFASLALAACSSTKPTYQTTNAVEKKFFKQADFDVTPNRVAKDLEDYKDTIVGWAGVVLDRKVKEKKRGEFEVDVLLEHRTFDWQQNVTKNLKETFQIGRKSGGRIRIFGAYSRPKGSKIVPGQELAPGNLVIAYGTPERVDKDGVVLLNSGFVRPIEKKFYSVKP